MTTFQSSAGNLVPYRVLLTTSNQNIVSAAQGTRSIAKIWLSNVNAASRTFDLEIYNGTTQQYIAFTHQLSGKGGDAAYWEYRDDILPTGSYLRALASADNSVWIHVLAALPNKPTG